MQDPLFHLTPEQPLDLQQLFAPATGADGGDVSQQQESTNPDSLDNAEMDSENAQDMQEALDELIEEEGEDSDSLAEKIRNIEKSYNENPVPIYGQIGKKLLTLAGSLTEQKFCAEARQVVRLLDGE